MRLPRSGRRLGGHVLPRVHASARGVSRGGQKTWRSLRRGGARLHSPHACSLLPSWRARACRSDAAHLTLRARRAGATSSSARCACSPSSMATWAGCVSGTARCRGSSPRSYARGSARRRASSCPPAPFRCTSREDPPCTRARDVHRAVLLYPLWNQRTAGLYPSIMDLCMWCRFAVFFLVQESSIFTTSAHNPHRSAVHSHTIVVSVLVSRDRIFSKG